MPTTTQAESSDRYHRNGGEWWYVQSTGSYSPALITAVENQKGGQPRSRLFAVAHRIAARFEPAVARAFLDAVRRLQRRIDNAALVSAVASGNLDAIEAAVGVHELAILLEASQLTGRLEATTTATGSAGADVLSGALGVSVRFNATDPNAILFARRQGAQLVRHVTDDIKEAIRLVVAAGQAYGLTVDEQAVAITEIIGLPKNWAAAPLNFANELRERRLNRRRLLHDPALPPSQRFGMQRRVETEIADRIGRGTVTESFVRKHQAAYARNLTRSRALNIATTETMKASNHGLRTGWRQARDDGVLPDTAKRVVVVTPDERLRELHAEAGRMNEEGVGLDEPFETPWGPLEGPPWAPDPNRCRCSEGLTFPGLRGVL